MGKSMFHLVLQNSPATGTEMNPQSELQISVHTELLHSVHCESVLSDNITRTETSSFLRKLYLPMRGRYKKKTQDFDFV